MKKVFSLLTALLFISSFTFAQITQEWVGIFDGGINDADAPYASTADGNGNTYLTGFSTTALGVDLSVAKFNSSGALQWNASFDGVAGLSDSGNAIAVDASGNVYVTGHSYNAALNKDYVTIKYNSAGVQQWTAFYNGAANLDDEGLGITTDATGNVYVTGSSTNATDKDYLTVKYNSAGVQQWAMAFDRTPGSNDYAKDIKVDGSGNVYISGLSDDAGNLDLATVQYDNSGVQQWAAVYNGPANGLDQYAGMVIDASGNTFVGGTASLLTGQGFVAIKYDNTGSQVFASTYNETPTSVDLAYATTVDGSGNIYMTGFSSDAGISSVASIKFDNTGILQWSSLYTGPLGSDNGNSIITDAPGNVYVSGETMDPVENGNFVTIKYNSAGVQQWIKFYNGTSSSTDVPTGIYLDAAGAVYVAGQSDNVPTNMDFGVVKYSLTPLSATQSQTDLTCNAVCNGTATVVASGGIAPYTYSWTSGGNAATETGLCAGNYTCTITDANADFIDVTFTITEPTALASVNSQTNVSCFAGNNGTATVAVSGGTGAYTYDWTGTPTGDGTNAITGLVAGNYTCTITDANSCTFSATFAITAPVVLNAVKSQTNITCFGGSNGTATVAPTGGTPPFSYAWAPFGGTAATATSLVAGVYTVTITDANSCSVQKFFNITQPSPVNSTPGQTDVTCNGNPDGFASAVAFGGVAPYTYAWAPSGGTGSTESGLVAGNYTCTITDANGCIFNQLFFITEPAPLVSANMQTNISCNGGNNGDAMVMVSGGTSPYSYLWAPGGETTDTKSSLVAGSYTCTIMDANNCVLTETFSITEPAVALSATTSQTDNTCNAATAGSATVVVSGGTPAYSYAWSPTGGTAATASSLAAGNYTCTITDANACSLTETFTITEPSAIAATASQTNVSCNGGNNGSAAVVASGGTPAYTYSWAPSGGTSATASSLSAGNYTCTITDANACTFTVTFLITGPLPLSSANMQTNISCNGGNNGDAMVMVSGGTAPYTYSWSPGGGTTATASSLTAGNYTCTITDANSCVLTETFAITEPALLASVNMQTNISCNGGSTGDAMVMISGGTAAYSYLWSPSGGTAATASSLSAGTYTCTITDANNCTLTETFSITEPAALSSANMQTNVSCSGGNNGDAMVMISGGTPAYTYVWAPTGGNAATASSLSAGNYTCTITDANSCTLTETFSITAPAGFTVTSSQTDVTCNGNADATASVVVSGGTPAYSYAWTPVGGTAATASSLTAGNYTCTITDGNSCSATATFNITEPALLLASASQTNNSCNGGNNGSATVGVVGGTFPYSYSWSPGGGTAATASSLAAGNYTCTITDANGCSTNATVTITEPAAITVSSSQTNISCNGNSDGSASVLASGGTPGYTYFWLPSGGTASTATSLGTGTYTCTITDANGCTATATVMIIEPAAITTTDSQTNISCSGGSDGTATVVVSGGTPAYSYSWFPSGGFAATASGLTNGNYTCTITDANSCSTTATFTITSPTVIAFTSSQTNISCNGAADGTATVVVSGGTPAYSYAWAPTGGTAATASSLAAGNYTCTITDANGCTATATFTITEPTGIIASNAAQTNVTCFGGNDGSATVMASGGVGALTYDWTPGTPTGDGTVTVTGLTAGTWTCTVTDANGCTTTQTFTITEAPAMAVVSSQTNISCNGANNGTATVVVSGGAPAYSYLWTPSGGTAATASGLSAGSYTCTITDATSCTTTSAFNITEPAILSSVNTQTNVSCFGGTNGSATVTVSGGTTSYSYAWAPAGGTSATASGLTAGNYTCTITDANGCILTETFTLTAPSAITSTNTQTDINCFGGNNGSATVTVSGGTPAYTYAWAPSGGTGATESGLTAGNYTCTITDANSCTLTETFTLTQVPAFTVITSQTNVTCNGGTDGSATVVVSGGTPAYTYAWSPAGGTAATATGLAAGSYTCVITDATSCSFSQTFSLTQPPAIATTGTQTNVSCNGGSNGSATVNATGGTSPYSYAWAPTGGTAASATGLVSGTYTVTVTDLNGCTATQSFTITQPPVISTTGTSTNVSCFGGSNGSATVVASGGTGTFTYAWAPTGGTAATASGLTAGNYTVTVTDVNGCVGTQTLSITQPPAITTTGTSTNVSCFGGSNGSASVIASGGTGTFTYSWAPTGGTAATATGLIAGNYTVTVTDANGCTATPSFSITQPPVITTTGTQTNVSCFGGSNGSATVTAAGGTGTFTYNWTPGNPTGDGTNTVTGLTPGTWTVTVTDVNGCTTTQTFSITQPPAITTTGTSANVSCFGGSNGSATVVATGGTGTFTYAWAPAGGTAATATGLTAGTYTVTVTDANGCTTTRSFTITAPTPLTVTSSQTNISCNAGNNGSATVVVTGGTPSYTYAWLPTGGNAATASALTAGNYTCTITDANLCSTTATFSITQPAALAVTSTQTSISCFGGSNGTATVSVTGGTPSYTYAWAPTGGTSATATGLSAGTYTCTITDANSCIITKTVTITQPALLTATTATVNVSCNGGTNGQATVIVSGGTTAYSYAWSSGGTAMTEFNLSAGSYTCVITDANGCTTSQSVTITEPTPLTTSATQTDLLCFGGTNGSAGVVASGGTPGYTYLWSPGGATTPTVNGLTAGSYTCTITDTNLCTLTQGFLLTQPNILAVTATSTNVICQGGGNGTAHVSVTGGTMNYSFLWSPGGGTDSTATGLSAGSYTCNITDANGCTTNATVSIVEPSPIFVAPSHTNATCFGGTDGTAAVVVTGGFTPYTYAWSPSGGTASTATNLSAGTYTCLITDAGGCTFSQTVSIVSPSPLVAAASQTNVGCNGGSNGSATIFVTGGSPFYSYSWLPSGGTGPIATGLTQGTYTCNVSDANGCSMTQTYLITEPVILATTISSTNTNCSQSNGTATLIASGGIAPYTYSWSPTGGNAATANAILAGTYTCTLTDANGCTTSDTVVVNDTPAPTLSLVSQTNILCNGNNNGDATVLASGGVGPYTYAWTPTGGTGTTASLLLAGTYTCTVTDSAGCTATQAATITEPTLLAASATSTGILCNGGSTTITVIANGGASPYTGEGTFTDTAGTYSYIITDANGCTTTTSITVTEPGVLTISAIPASILCNGAATTVTVAAAGGTGSYTGEGTFVEFAGTYTYTVTDTNGCTASTSLTITEPTALSDTAIATSILCNGGTALVTVSANGGTAPYTGTGSFTEIAGTYNYIVTDANGCTTSAGVTITEPTLLVSVIDSVTNPSGCLATDGMIFVSTSGGTTGYAFLWTNSATNEDISGLTAGTYACTVTDTNGCVTTVNATLTDPAPPVVTTSIDTTICSANAPYVLTEGNPTGGTWTGTSVSGNAFDPAIGVGSYVLSYTFTAPNGCTATATDTMVVDACIGIEEVPGTVTWSAFPNPTFGNVTLSANGNENENHLVEVYSAEGKMIISERFNAGSIIQVNMEGQAAGIYMVRIISQAETSTIRIIKQ